MTRILEQLLAELQAEKAGGRIGTGLKHDFPSGTPSLPYYTGPNGLFYMPGVERDFFSTRLQPRGLASMLPASGSMTMYPLFGYVTGYQDVTGSNPDGVCDEPQVAGPAKNCMQTAQYGRYSYKTREFEVNRVGQQVDRAEMMDIRILNDPLYQDMGGNGLLNPGVPGGFNPRNEAAMRFQEVGVAFQNKLIRQIYEGNPSNNTANDGYREFPGLNILIGTNKVDALTGTRCPSLDSEVFNFNYARIDANAGSRALNLLSYLMRKMRHQAERQGFNPVQWAFAMRSSLFWELTAVWPCTYMTYRCQFGSDQSQARVNVDAGDQIAMRDSMRNENYIIIDGIRYPVILDDGIDEDTNTEQTGVTSGCFASDIYILPLTVMGGMPVLYWQYLNYQAGAMEAVEAGRLGAYYWTDGGRYLWHAKPPNNWCVQWVAKIEPRLILRTPHLAARIQNVQYCPTLHEKDTVIGDPYFVDGGVTSRTSRNLYSDWNLQATAGNM